MPKKFTEQEREWIKHKLLTEGRRCFEVHGIKKTSVEELTKAAGIAQGSFYMFFDRKRNCSITYCLKRNNEFVVQCSIHLA